MAKNNIRSIRFSDKLAALIDQQVGDTFQRRTIESYKMKIPRQPRLAGRFYGDDQRRTYRRRE